jgi:hypothetical protein
MKRSLFILSALAVMVSCNDHDHNSHDHGGQNDVNVGDMLVGDTTGNLSADTYSEGMEKMAASGHYKIRLDMSSPAPKDTGNYTWTLSLMDMEGNAVQDATVNAEPTMPQHGHGTDPKFTDATAGEHNGQYVLTDMNLFMPGIWQVMITVNKGEMTDTVTFLFDLEG